MRTRAASMLSIIACPRAVTEASRTRLSALPARRSASPAASSLTDLPAHRTVVPADPIGQLDHADRPEALDDDQ